MLRRIWQSPRLIPALSVATVLALAAAAFAVFGVLAVDDAREQDRIDSDLAACERVNRLRVEVVALDGAGQEMLEGILDVVLPSGSQPRIDEIRDRLQPVLDRHQARIDDIQLTDCTDAVPGATIPTEGP